MKNKRYFLYLFILTLFSIYIFVETYLIADDLHLGMLLFWSIFAVISESNQITLPSGASTSVGMAIYLGVLITTNAFVALCVVVVAFLVRVQVVNGERLFLFKFSPDIVLYNVTSHMVSVGIMGLIYHHLISASTEFHVIMIISICLLALTELLSIIMISVYYYMKFGERDIPLIKSFIGALPSTLLVGTLGLILAFAAMQYGVHIVALFFLPLLLARYSYKLYFDSQKTGQETIEALNAALHYRDAYTAGHTKRVEIYTVMLAKAMNYTGRDLERIKLAARLHDIGKIGVPDRILHKPGKLTEEEYQRIKDHAAMGAQILSNVDSLKKITEIVRQHHERPDGRGYPDGLKKEEISFEASILSIADTYDAMTSKRPYRNASSKEYAISELRKYRGTQFREELVEVFIEELKKLDETQLDFTMPETYYRGTEYEDGGPAETEKVAL